MLVCPGFHLVVRPEIGYAGKQTFRPVVGKESHDVVIVNAVVLKCGADFVKQGAAAHKDTAMLGTVAALPRSDDVVEGKARCEKNKEVCGEENKAFLPVTDVAVVEEKDEDNGKKSERYPHPCDGMQNLELVNRTPLGDGRKDKGGDDISQIEREVCTVVLVIRIERDADAEEGIKIEHNKIYRTDAVHQEEVVSEVCFVSAHCFIFLLVAGKYRNTFGCC